MLRFLLSNLLILFLFPSLSQAQSCEMLEVNATALTCDGNYFFVSIDLEVTNPGTGFTLAGNGVIYGTFLYSELPVIVGPLLGDNESVYEFIAWDVENPACQQFTNLEAINCGPICDFSNAVLELVTCVNNNFAIVELDFDHQGTTNPAFDVFYENGNEVGSYLYESLPVTIPSFAVNGAETIMLTICDNNNLDCCETFEFDAIDCNPNNCEIFNVTLDPECTGSNFVVHLDFDFDNVASDSFTIEGNSLNYGSFGYNELPLELGPLNGGTNIIWQFHIQDSELATCQETAVLGVYNCPPPCDILVLEVEVIECDGNEAYVLSLGFEIEGEGDNGYAVFSESAFYGTYEYDDNPLVLENIQGSDSIVDIVTVCDIEIPGCCASVAYEALLCSGCIIYNLNAVPQPCNLENEIFVSLDFDFQNVSGDGFSVSGNGTQYGTFMYEEVPVLIGPFPGDGSQFLEFVVTDLANGDCFDATEIGLLACGDICELSELVVETGECTGNNTYVVSLDFNFENVIGDNFDLFVNGEFYDGFSYNDLPLTLEEFPSGGNDLDTITVCDNDNEDCCTTVVFEAVPCACSIFDATIQVIGCTSDSTFAVELEFFYENLPGDFVDVFFDGVFLGFYSVNDIPLLIENIPEGDGNGILSVCANDLNNCCDEVVVELMNCEGPECIIFDLFAELGDCTSDSTVILDVVFGHSNLPGDSVIIYANDELIGTYLIEPEFIHIENFPVFDANLTNITVCAVGEIGCCDTYTFESPNCTPGGCEISDLIADPGECLTDSTFTIVIEYNSGNVPGDSVVVTGNGNVIGTFVDPDEHIVIEHFPQYETANTVITVCSVTFPDCCDVYEFDTPNCGEGNECNIFDLVVNFEGCQTDSTYTVAVNFEHNNLPGDSVTIIANEQLIGHFPANDGHIILPNFPVFPGNLTVVSVCAFGSPDCCDVYTFETPNCEGGNDCNIFDLVVNFEGCQSDSTYTVAVNFEYNNLPSNFVIVSANGQSLGGFPVNDGHIIITNMPLIPTNTTVITVCADGAPDCCDVYEFETPNCEGGGECNIYDIGVDIADCTSDTTFGAIISFQYENITGGGFDLYTGDSYLGFFNFDQIPVITANFPVNATGEYVVTICESDNLDCCESFEFEGPVCGEDICDIFNFEWSITECDSAGNFFFILNFDFQNVGNEGFNVVGNGNNYGNFSYENLPIQVGPFESDNTVYEFLVIDGQNGACFDFVEPGVVECLVATTEIPHDNIFQVFNNGTIPGILALEDVNLSIFNLNGKMLVNRKLLASGNLFELNDIPSGLYIGTVMFEGYTWPIKLVKNSH